MTVAFGVAPRSAAQAETRGAGTAQSARSAPAAAPATASPAATAAATAAPVTSSTPATSKPKSPVELHEERVEKLQKLASDLQATCSLDAPAWAAKEKEIKARFARDLRSRYVKAQAEASGLEAAVKKSTEKISQLQKEKKELEDEKQKLGDNFKKQDRLDAIAKELPGLILLEGIDKKQLDQASTAAKEVADLIADLDKADGVFAKSVDRTTTCAALCNTVSPDKSVKLATALDLCAFRDAVPATAAVLADWESVDALASHVGGPRRTLREKFGVDVPELPEDPFPETVGPRAKAPVATGSNPTPAPANPNPTPAPANTPAGNGAKETAPAPSTQPASGGGASSVSSPGSPGGASSSSDEIEVPDECSGRVDPNKREAAPLALLSGLGGLDLGATAAQTADVALAALAKVIADRAKRESLVWFLEKMQEHVCGGEDTDQKMAAILDLKSLDEALTARCVEEHDALKSEASAPEAEKKKAEAAVEAAEDAREKAHEAYKAAKEEHDKCDAACVQRLEAFREIRTFWLPTTCALARKRMDYVQYGGGANLVRALQGAVATDVRGWPGSAAGFGVGALYWTTATSPGRPLKDSFACDPGTYRSTNSSDGPLCEATVGVRRATATFVGQIQGGADALSSMYLYGSELDRLNSKDMTETVRHEPFQVSACLMSLPHVLQSFGEHAKATTDERKDELEALFLAGLAGAPACWKITGKGLDRDKCSLFGGQGGECDASHKKPPLKVPAARLERLSTILRWYVNADAAAERVIAQWEVVRAAWKSYFAALTALRQSGGGTPFAPPAFDSSGIAKKTPTLEEVLAAVEAHVEKTARAAQQTQQVKLLQASAALARSSLDFGVVLTDVLSGQAAPDLYPGLKVDPRTSTILQETSKRLAEMSRHVSTAEQALTQDWGAVVASVVATTRTVVEAQCKSDPQCSQLMERLSRYSGLFSALVSERDPEKVAEALDAAAMPIGGWRLKQVEHTFTASLTAFPGFGTGLEKRWGQYGVNRENGDETYWAAPTLQLPFGLDLAFGEGGGSGGFFISLLDPAAYLHYDPDKQGRLPGAQLLTALAPGLALRQSLGRSPFVVTAYMVARPNFRAWESDVASPGATALQLGLSLGVDVTLFELFSTRMDP